MSAGVVVVALLALVAGAARAQVEESPPRGAAAPPSAERLPTLDELLGLEESGPPREDERGLPMDDPTRRELDRTLDGSEVGEAFVEAVSLMEESAQRIRVGRDTGLTTQRLQEDILRKLDQIIESSQQGQSSSSSSSSDPQQNQPDQQQQDTQRNQNSSSSSENTEAPAEQDGRLGSPGSLNTASWGALRERLREALTQGTSDPFSSLYRSMTEEYYKRLAEGERR